MTRTGETTRTTGPARTSSIEIHSIQPIPDSERYGTVGQQWPLWFTSERSEWTATIS
jgi:hypothetical protein